MKNLKRIRDLRKKNQISQSDLAKKLNISQSTIAMWETGKALPRTDKLPILAKIFNCSVDDLLKE